MRKKLKIDFTIPQDEEAKIVGDLFKLYIARRRDGEEFSISDHKLHMVIFLSKDGYMHYRANEITSLISTLPFDKIKDLNIEEIEEKSDDKKITLRGRTGNVTFNAMDDAGKDIFERNAIESKSFEDFIAKMGEFIGIKEEEQLFYHRIIKAALYTGEPSVSELCLMIREPEGYNYDFYNNMDTIVSSRLDKAFKSIGSKVKLTAFLREIIKYKDYEFFGESNFESVEGKETDKAIALKILPKKAIKLCEESGTAGFICYNNVRIICELILSKRDIFYCLSSYGQSKIIFTLLDALGDFAKGEDLKSAISEHSKDLYYGGMEDLTSEKVIYQIIEKYCQSIWYYNNSMYEDFFEDMIKIMS